MSNMMEAGNQAGNLEYMQMFNQFYQLFSQLQTLQAQSPDAGGDDLMNNETFI